jgi:prolyl-tRNA editing enzyme YbaK/EbsC (Cys-tRNA(Pro) deacylase)
VHANAERVAAALRAGGATGEVRELTGSARTADDAARALGVPVGAIVKSLVFDADGAAVLVLASGDHRVDTEAVARLLTKARVRRADPDLVREATGFPIGGVAPFSHPTPLPTLIDRHLGDFDIVWAAAGTPNTVFPTSFDELLRMTAGAAADIGVGG